MKSPLFGKDPDAEKDSRHGMAEDEMIGLRHQLNGHESEQTPGDGEGQRGLPCCNPWVHKDLDTTEQQEQQLLRYMT